MKTNEFKRDNIITFSLLIFSIIFTICATRTLNHNIKIGICFLILDIMCVLAYLVKELIWVKKKEKALKNLMAKFENLDHNSKL